MKDLMIEIAHVYYADLRVKKSDRYLTLSIIVSAIFILSEYSVSCTLLYLNIFHSKDGQDDRISAADLNQSSAPLSYNFFFTQPCVYTFKIKV